MLDAACGTGKYFGIVLDSGRSLLGVDHSAGHLARAREKLPDVPTERRDLQQLPYREEFDGVMCVDAMEMIPPEDWPVIIEGFRRALRPGGRLYLTVERVPGDQVGRGGEDARRSGLPVVEGEVMWEDDLYHHYPSMDRVWVWLADAGFVVDEDLEGPGTRRTTTATTTSWPMPRSAPARIRAPLAGHRAKLATPPPASRERVTKPAVGKASPPFDTLSGSLYSVSFVVVREPGPRSPLCVQGNRGADVCRPWAQDKG